jgi:hypothetical protein
MSQKPLQVYSQKDIRMAKRHMTRCSALAIREMQITTGYRYTFRMAKMQNTRTPHAMLLVRMHLEDSFLQNRTRPSWLLSSNYTP